MGGGLIGVVVRRPDIGLLWSGLLLSALGDRLHQMALVWIAIEALGGSAGVVAVSSTFAHLVFGLPGGIAADRWNRRRTMITSDLLRALAVATLAVAALSGAVSLWHLAVVGAVLGAFDSFFVPALQASLPALAGDAATLQGANALMNINYRLALILGPSLAGVLLAFVPITSFFAIDAVTFVVAAAAVAAIGRHPAWQPGAHGPAAGARSEIAEALRLAWGDAVLPWAMALLMTCNLAHAVGWIVGLPLLARDVFGGGPETYGYLMAAYGVGNVASNLLVGSLTVRRRERMLFGGGIVYGLGFLLVAVAPSFEIALVASALAAVGGPMTDLMILLLVQTRIPTAHVGKVLSLRYTISQASLGAALLLAAPIYVWLPVRAAIAVVGLIVVGCAVVASLRLTSPPADPARRSARAPW